MGAGDCVLAKCKGVGELPIVQAHVDVKVRAEESMRSVFRLDAVRR